jgi:MFS transporter, SET family, sugar efflux transporter
LLTTATIAIVVSIDVFVLEVVVLPNSSLFSAKTIVLYLFTILLGSMYALIAPTLSLYLSEHLGARPLAVGAFFLGTALASIVYGQFIGVWSDRIQQRHGLILAGLCMGGLACFLFAATANYWFILTAGVTLFSLSSIVLPQVFALTREYADHSLPPEKSALFNAIVRSCIAIAWVAAPPVGFFLQAWIGFEKHYVIVGLLHIFIGVFAFYVLPHTPKFSATKPSVNLPQKNAGLILAIVAFALLFGTNHSYVLGLPLLVSQELQLPAANAGWLMGTAAALEIPVMIMAGWLANRLGLIGMIRFGCLAAVGLYAGMWLASSLQQLFLLQLLNALFVGCCSGLGITLFQNMMPGKAGVASTLFTNTNQMGNIIGSIFIAVFADLFGYRHLYAINMVAAAIALVALLMIQRDRVQPTARLEN